MNLRKIKTALISVSNKSNLNVILPTLKKFNIRIISSGGTYKKIKSMKYNAIEISNYTKFSEMLNGRVKTLHPKIHAGILNIRDNKKHKKELLEQKILNIDLVIVDLYPFEKKLEEKIKFKNLIEFIDIGGSTLLRSAAKNFNDVAVISEVNDYSLLVKEIKKNKGATSIRFRKFMSAKAFTLTAYYDSVISNWFNNELNIKFSNKKTIHGKLIEELRYGENPHQKGSIYGIRDNLGIVKIHGKSLSYNNYNDIYSALSILNSFKKNQGVTIIKHANPCGASIEKDQFNSFKNAFNCDPISAFGGIVAINSMLTKKLAIELNKKFFEVIVSKGFKKDALKILKQKKSIRLIDSSKFDIINIQNYNFLDNAFLVQDSDDKLILEKIKIVTKKKPSNYQLQNLIFAFNLSKFAKSNAIILANNKSTIGIGSGQPSRLDSCKIATSKALKFSPEKLKNSIAASDAFFPFSDGIKELIKVGVGAIIQPGGSINDKEVIKTANKAGIVMAFTGTRHFKH
jgi:phosphoribosylaminoimidazolecarboxamide formyltransferase/IMP cyclohydrolase